MRHLILLQLLVFASIGCNQVFVDQPFGEPVSKEYRDALRGTWSDGDGSLFHIETGNDGRAFLGITRWNSSKESFVTDNTTVHMRLVGGRPLLFFRGEEKDETPYSFLWLSTVERESIKVRTPLAERFKELVNDGTLSGEIDKVDGKHFTVRLKVTPEIEKILATSDGELMFGKEGDKLLRRLTSTNDR